MSETAYDRRLAPAHPAHAPRAGAHALNDAPRVAQLKAIGAQLNGGTVVQRVVLHKIKKGEIRYYSSYRPAQDFADRADAEALDDELRANEDNVSNALTTSQGRDRRMPTPFSYHPKQSVSGAVRGQLSGPHSLSFSSTEYRLQRRLERGQQDEIPAQILSPEEFNQQLADESDPSWDTRRHRERAELDYASVHDRFQELHAGDDRGVGSEYHEIVRRAMQMAPYVTYGNSKGSKGMGERSRAPFGTGTLDLNAKTRVKNPKGLKSYLKKRKNLFHDSDSEDDRSDYEDYVFSEDEAEPPLLKKRPPDDDDDDDAGGGTGGGGGLAGGILVE